jgi:hypothetical protein
LGSATPFLYIKAHVVIALGTPRGIVTKTPLTSFNLPNKTENKERQDKVILRRLKSTQSLQEVSSVELVLTNMNH